VTDMCHIQSTPPVILVMTARKGRCTYETLARPHERLAVDRVFLMAPAGVIRVYLFHPHRHALTMELRGEDKHNAYRGVSEKCVPLWHEGVLCLDLDTLRKLEAAGEETRAAILTPPHA
jgi:hypothetical protein